ncbi:MULTISPECIES: glycine cleavage system aminomethyltransferase GcvT [unclassified Thermosynechococcus]|uniref:glycine cleavage system aminomethyltransferase GcvT n=1 Tax=unclassified Thermosynechococcus TaxID=2622553 RepID=UPI0019DA4215|nr:MULTISPECIES: glycine cleavage system aminomethyltransferase GcvT [unclassified Thermosynechococcus]HIK35510.1 glycine cleavage system aminomethyltransferase GcvT [Thermosynechococcus sp. M98_K2018_005]HIK48667.1 glycine cleavage system aminomethyltransferase GcvT [Thermosynechococcus sp. M55_K2018_012]
MAEALRRTPLYPLHQGARFTPFGEWEMPLQYSSILQEHQAVRQRVGMFDISHMGKFLLRGSEAIAALQERVPTNLSRLQPGQAKYTVLLNEAGGIVDDVILYVDDGQIRCIVNAATTAKDWAWFQTYLPTRIELIDESATQVLIALQGPAATATLAPLCDRPLDDIKAYRHAQVNLLGQPAWIARTGYTGEEGWEILVTPELGQQLWQTLLAAGVTPCGLGARDTLRLEAAMLLYGQDMDEQTTPLEAGLDWLVDWQKPNFVGRAALWAQKQQGIGRQLVGLELVGKGIARHGYRIYAGAQAVGEVTSGTLSPTLGKAIALGYVFPEFAHIGRELEVQVRDRQVPAVVVPRPFYRRPR